MSLFIRIQQRQNTIFEQFILQRKQFHCLFYLQFQGIKNLLNKIQLMCSVRSEFRLTLYLFFQVFFFSFSAPQNLGKCFILCLILLFGAIVTMDSSFPLSFVCFWNKYFIALLTFVRECDREWNQFSDVMEYEYNIHYMFGFLKVLCLSSFKWNCTISFSLLFTMVKFPAELMSSMHVLFDFNLFVFQNQKLLTYIKSHEQLLFVLLLLLLSFSINNLYLQFVLVSSGLTVCSFWPFDHRLLIVSYVSIHIQQ